MTLPSKVRRTGKETQQVILDATGELIAEKGIDGFSMSDVGRHAGINRALIYHYFENRDNLINEAVDHIMGTHEPIDAYITPDSVAALARERIEDPKISRLFFQMLLGDRQMPLIGGRIKETIAKLVVLQQERNPTETYDPAFALLALVLVQHAWPFARDEFARLLEMEREEADERFIDFLRWATELTLKATGQPTA